jgi:hypothetical protein
LGVGLDQVGPEGLEVGIDVAADIGAPRTIVNVARARERDLGRARGQRREKAKIVGVLWSFPGDAAHNRRNALRHPVAMGLRTGPAAVLGHFDLHAGNAGAGERIGIGAPPELAVGDDLQTDVFLQLDHAGDGLVFDFPQRLAIEFAGRVPLACAQEFARTHQAADMFGAEGRRSHHSCTPRRGQS